FNIDYFLGRCYNFNVKIKSVSVKNFRNLAEQKTMLADGLNVFVGNNAQGKTNLLESVYLCCLGKSPRTDKDKDMICWGEDNAKANVDFVSKYGERNISIELTRDKKSVFLNDTSLNKIGDLLGNLNCVFFSPDEIRVITQSPAERRRFLDIDLCQTDKTYFRSLVRFNRILTQRNNLIKNSATIKELSETLAGWDDQLAKEGARITIKRREFCDMLSPKAAETHKKLTKTENFELSYQASISGETAEEIYEKYLKKLNESIEKDFYQRFTTFGCQRDDIKFSVNGIDIRSFGSQGQQRTAALALKFAELEIFKIVTGEYPILLLDDVLSELDRSRQKALLCFNDEVQIILTATKVETALIKNIPHKKFAIKNGVASSQ
ncbi:MAG: DNA replication/repair protein RecF, partial [Clostridia bacterium]|nr:DNA replication/repair protein RecF [Clostridia bacterium]